MSKNAIIWVLVIVIVLGGGYYLFTSGQNTSNTNQPYTTSPNPLPTTSNTNPSATINPIVPPLTLASPTLQTGSNFSVSSGGVSVTGMVTPNGLPTTYWFEYGTTSVLGSRTVSELIGSGFSPISSPLFITGLSPNTTYYFRLMASNNLGTMTGDTYSFTTNSNPTPKPATPTSRTNSATNIAQISASLNGQVNPNGFQTNYWFEYGKSNAFGNTTSITSVNENVPLTSLVSVSNPLSGLEPLTKYYFRLNAQNQFGTVNGATLNFTTKGPANPKK